MEEATPNAATASFQLAIPSLLTSISPHLAAWHATRARRRTPSEPSLASTHCSRCGLPFIASGARTRSLRKKTKKSSTIVRVLRRSCPACGHNDDVPLDAANAPVFPKVRDRAARKSSTAPHGPGAPSAFDPASTHRAQVSQPHASQLTRSAETPASSRSSSLAPLPTRSTPAPALSSTSGRAPSAKPAPPATPEQTPSQTKSRQKKKAGLQSLLARNREKQEQEKKRDGQGQGGLSAFLQGL
ncbi:hypothetical protein C8Q79DRAFT_1007027 [Trametes meyenii]|nr:hypothetical protein C8Q79DRAFT_1007027 [Trametes meyenii]